MRRSHAPSIKKLGGGGGEDEGDTRSSSSMMITGESIMARRNAAAVASGRCIVSREPITNWLMCQQGPPVVKTKFISPSNNRTSDSDQLFKKKSIGMRKPQAHQFIRSTGMAGSGRFAAPLQDMTNFDDDPAAAAAAAAEADVDLLGPDSGAAGAVPEEERTWEPLVLWEGEVEQEDGESLVHRIQVADRLCKVLRPHQREGVQFVFECLTGQREFDGSGCILADDMGLGKTLQSIVILHTLLKNGFKPGERIARKAIVVTPTSLIKNWANEIKKWVGEDPDMQVVAITESGKNIKIEINRFLGCPRNRILVISYETFRGHGKSFPAGCEGCCDVLICDEAHRLKNAETATNQSLAKLHCRRRILLSGTPLQNDLNEFYAMVDFTNPGILGTPSQFRRNVVRHILAGREPDASDAEVKKAQDCQTDMSELVNQFVLRRTNTLNAQHLPPKLVQVVCCRLTDLQKRIYKHLLSSKEIRHIFEGKQTNILSSIGALQKLCNHPMLLAEPPPAASSSRGGAAVNYSLAAASRDPSAGAAGIGLQEIAHLLPADDGYMHGPGGGGGGGGMRGRGIGGGGMMGGGSYRMVRAELSGKMLVLERLMQQMRASGNDRIVIVSNYTQTLDMIGHLCSGRGWPVVRLDGSTNVTKRQKLVDVFNDPYSQSFAFLLSSKAGGCGINLIGANRLVLFDPDWNPAVDKQAAARVWREGQKKRCFIYRFMSTGTIEEKIFMRQLSKEGLQSIVDDKQEVNTLSSKDLRQLFRFDETTVSDTHKKLACKRCPLAALKGAAAEGGGGGAAGALNKTQSAAVRQFVMGLQEGPLMAAVTASMAGLLEDLPVEERVDLLSLDEVLRRLDAGEYSSLPAFTKHMRKQIDALDKASTKAQDTELQAIVYKFSTAFEQELRALAPTLIHLREEKENEESKEGEGKEKEQKEKEKEKEEQAKGEEGGEEAVRFQSQMGMPLEEDLNHWSHHWSIDTVDDTVLRDAMLGAGLDPVSFVFGLEVTWDLLQRFPQPEVKKVKRKNKKKEKEEEEEEGEKGEKEGGGSGSDSDGSSSSGSGSGSVSGSDGDSDSSSEEEDDEEVQEVKKPAARRGRPPAKAKQEQEKKTSPSSTAAGKGGKRKVVVEEEEEESESDGSFASSSSEGEGGGEEDPDGTESESDEQPRRTRKKTPQKKEAVKDVILCLSSDEDGGASSSEDENENEKKGEASVAAVAAVAGGGGGGGDADEEESVVDHDPGDYYDEMEYGEAGDYIDVNAEEDEGNAAGSTVLMEQDENSNDSSTSSSKKKEKKRVAESLSPVKANGNKKKASSSFATTHDQDHDASQPTTSSDSTAWSCPQCTFKNAPMKRKCEICACNKPTTSGSSRRRRGASQSSENNDALNYSF